jgi:pilus assembly protein CpaF
MQHDTQLAKAILEQSFLAPFLQQTDITDITFNGEQLFYLSSQKGRQPLPMKVDFTMCYNLLKQLANLLHQPFTFSDPILDMSVGPYRIHAVGPTLTRKFNHASVSFSIRIHRYHDRIASLFLEQGTLAYAFLKTWVGQQRSIVITGKTGAGKTQLQKELLQLMPAWSRVIIIDNILELDGLPSLNLDMTVWQVHEQQQYHTMIVAALRSTPDWIILAESRGKEFHDVYESVLTGHPIMTTLHSPSAREGYTRMQHLLSLTAGYPEVNQATLHHHFPCMIHVEKIYINGRYHRRIDHMLVFDGHHMHHWNEAMVMKKTIKQLGQQ